MVSKDELKHLIDYLKSQGIEPEYNTEVTSLPVRELPGAGLGNDEIDEFYDVAKEYVIAAQRASASLLQTRLSIGFNRATRLLQQLENNGIVGPQNGAKPRTVLVKNSGNDMTDAFEKSEDMEEDNEKDFAA
jgi:S-DNA-T family DNA segregation ATPase FtsK/SpoIIIE